MDSTSPSWTFDEKTGSLSCVFGQVDSIPSSPPNGVPAKKVKSLDLSHNSIATVANLADYTSLETLILDNNDIDDLGPLPPSVVKGIQTIWLNNNKIVDIDDFLSSLGGAKKLKHLSLLKNPACPNSLTGKDQTDYERYRYYVLYHVPQLQFLDSTPVNSEELAEAKRVGRFMRVAKPKAPVENEAPESAENVPSDDVDVVDAAADENEGENGKGADHGSYFAYSRYVYCGAKSEGNRFILNDDL